ncbi:MAG: hypothetical protein IT454_18700 [Planctomycetes bacterium]|nr:hypothetical protein [Planctomycetota bacterium]
MSLSLTLLAAAAAAAFPTLVGGAADGAGPMLDPQQAFEQRCAGCHTELEFVEQLRASDDRAALALTWLERLATHGDTDARTDLALVRRWTANSARH